MEGTIGEIRIFASNFAPKNWAFCQGQIISIASNTALFSILGTTYGGNGSTTFALPNLSSRSALGAGQGPGLSLYTLGEMSGVETVTLLTTQIPSHTHNAMVQAGTGSGGTTATLFGVNGTGGADTPGGNYPGEDSGSGLTTYANAGTPVPMNSGSIQISNVTAPQPNVITGMTGSNAAHNNIQPSLALYYIICMYGIYPSRN